MLFPLWKPREEHRPRSNSGGEAAFRLQWLGTAGWIVRSASTTILIDPFVSRPSLVRVAFSRMESKPREVAPWLPEKIDAVLCGHSHYDHLLDAPAIALASGARLAGSASTAAFGRAAGIAEEKLVVIPPEGGSFEVGDVRVRFVASLHGKLGRFWVPFRGDAVAPTLPGRLWHYRMGGAYGLHLSTAGASLFHNGSADLIDANLAGLSADVLIAGLAGRTATRDYVSRLTGALSPTLVIPTHHDAFFAPLEQGVHLLPRINLEGFLSEVSMHAPRATKIEPGYRETIAVPAGDARGASLVI